MEEPTISDMMEAYSLDAIDFARENFQEQLDYSESSIEQVEQIAAKLYDDIPKGFFSRLLKKGPSEEEIELVSKMLGGYIGEVFIRSQGGEWKYHEQFSTFALNKGDSWLFPVSKVYKRLTNGEEDNLSSFYRIAKKQPWNS